MHDDVGGGQQTGTGLRTGIDAVYLPCTMTAVAQRMLGPQRWLLFQGQRGGR